LGVDSLPLEPKGAKKVNAVIVRALANFTASAVTIEKTMKLRYFHYPPIVKKYPPYTSHYPKYPQLFPATSHNHILS
jgi:hypothetical protein